MNLVSIFKDFKTDFELEEVVDYIKKRGGEEMGCIWITHDCGVELAIMLNKEKAYIHFFPGGDHAGFQLSPKDENAGKMIEFLADNGESTPMSSEYVVDVGVAIDVAKCFWNTGQRANEYSWDEL